MKQFFLRFTVLAAAVCCPLSSHPADGGPDELKDEPIPLRLKFVPLPQANHWYHVVNRRIFDQFLAEYPHIKPYRYNEFIVEGPQRRSADLMAIAAGTAPDVFGYGIDRVMFDVELAATYADQGFLEPLDDYFDAAIINENVNTDLRDKLMSPDGKTYAVANRSRLEGDVLYYRKDLFREAGIVDENGKAKPPTTWDELYEYAQRLTDPDAHEKPRYGIGMRPHGASRQSAKLQNFVYQAGGDIVRQRSDGKWECVLDEEAALLGARFFRKLAVGEWTRDGKTYRGVSKLYQDPTNKGVEDLWQDFARARVSDIAMIMTTANDLVIQSLIHRSGMDPYVLGVAPLPAGPAGPATVASIRVMSINRVGVDERTRAAAAEFVRFMISPEAERMYIEGAIEEGEAKAIPPFLLEEYGFYDEMERLHEGWADARKSVRKHGRFQPSCPGYSKISMHSMAKLSDMLIDDDRCATPEGIKAVITAEVDDINNAVFRTRPEPVMKRYRKFAWSILFSFVGFVTIIAVLVLGRGLREKVSASSIYVERVRPRTHLAVWLFVLPAFSAVLLWRYIPLLLGSVMAFQDYQLVGESTFVGLDNFIEAFLSPLFWKVLFNTFQYVGLTLAMGFVMPILLALAFSEIRRFTLMFRLIYYLPAITSPLVVMFLWKLLFRPDPKGFLNQFLATVSKLPFIEIGPQGWLADPNIAMACIVVVGVWSSAGPGSLIYLAALKAVPLDYYEAAGIDGCGFWRKLWHVTVPTLKPLLVINFLGAFVGAFRAMQNIFVMTGGGPADATRTLGIEIWFNAFMYLKFGYATAMAWILGSALIGFSVMQMRMINKVEFTRAQEN